MCVWSEDFPKSYRRAQGANRTIVNLWLDPHQGIAQRRTRSGADRYGI